MAKHKETTYHCDKCDKKLKSCNNTLQIVTKISEDDVFWDRLYLQIFRRHGAHNKGSEEQADLCKGCAVEILTDALERVKKGERISIGVVSPYQEGWEH
jgi:hypothetical protein